MEEKEDSTENVLIKGQSVVSMSGVNWEIDVNRQSHLLESKEKKNVLRVHAAIIRRED